MVFISLERSTDWDFHPIKESHTHTLDKNGSLYDPAGTESCNMQKDRKQIY